MKPGASHLLVVDGDQDTPILKIPLSSRSCVRNGGQCSEGHEVGKGGLLRELMPIRAQENIQDALFSPRAILWSGLPLLRPNEWAPAERGACRGGQLLAMGQARNSVYQCLPGEDEGNEA